MKKLIVISIVLFSCLQLFAQQKNESLRIFWPTEYQWKVLGNFEDSNSRFVQIIPGTENTQNWTIVGVMTKMKKAFRASNLDTIIKVFTNASLQESSLAKVTIIQKDPKSKNFWVIFKVETPSFPNDPIPESQLWYVIQGDSTVFSNFVAIRKAKLSNEFVMKWTKVFKASKFEYKE